MCMLNLGNAFPFPSGPLRTALILLHLWCHAHLGILLRIGLLFVGLLRGFVSETPR